MLTLTSPWAYFLLMAWFLCVAHLIARKDPPRHSPLNLPLESLRGLLATGVFFCHAVVTHYYLETGVWALPASAFYGYLGTATVDMFFFLSGFLFWSKCISEDGIRSKKEFYTARVRRLVPAYYASVGLILLVVFIQARFTVRVSPSQLGGELLAWLAFLPESINGVAQAPQIDAGVIWTLELEILFYALLPLIYWLFKGYRVFGYIGVLGCAFWYTWSRESFKNTSWVEEPLPMFLARFFAFGFGFGMLTAFLIMSRWSTKWIQHLRRRRWSIIPLIFLAAPVVLQLQQHSVSQFLTLIVPFVFVAAGNDLLGLLSMRSTLLLGKSSYSFYLTHGIVLYGLSHLLIPYISITKLTPPIYWLFIGCCGTITVCLSYSLYRLVELRFMKKGSAQAGSDLKHGFSAP